MIKTEITYSARRFCKAVGARPRAMLNSVSINLRWQRDITHLQKEEKAFPFTLVTWLIQYFANFKWKNGIIAKVNHLLHESSVHVECWRCYDVRKGSWVKIWHVTAHVVSRPNSLFMGSYGVRVNPYGFLVRGSGGKARTREKGKDRKRNKDYPR